MTVVRGSLQEVGNLNCGRGEQYESLQNLVQQESPKGDNKLVKSETKHANVASRWTARRLAQPKWPT